MTRASRRRASTSARSRTRRSSSTSRGAGTAARARATGATRCAPASSRSRPTSSRAPLAPPGEGRLGTAGRLRQPALQSSMRSSASARRRRRARERGSSGSASPSSNAFERAHEIGGVDAEHRRAVARVGRERRDDLSGCCGREPRHQVVLGADRPRRSRRRRVHGANDVRRRADVVRLLHRLEARTPDARGC